jgi:hypothetical protein
VQAIGCGAQRINTHNVRRQLCEKGSGQESEHERCSHNLRAAVEGGAQCTPMIVELQPCAVGARAADGREEKRTRMVIVAAAMAEDGSGESCSDEMTDGCELLRRAGRGGHELRGFGGMEGNGRDVLLSVTVVATQPTSRCCVLDLVHIWFQHQLHRRKALR